MKRTWTAAVVAGVVALAVASAHAATTGSSRSAAAKRGEYLANVGGCNDCHTPWKMGPKGPAPDLSRLLSGHPQDLATPPAPTPAMPWMGIFTATMTAWAGPWGVSFSANLTPDAETGLGKWTAQNFIQAMRTGRHMGRGRPILPPMPWEDFAKMTDDDLKATFAYLKSIPAIKNRVPDPMPPLTSGARAAGSSASDAP